jgi:hypothetical protein
MSTHVKLKQMTGVAVVWDGANQEEIRTLIDAAFLGVEYSQALIRVTNGNVIHLGQGGQVVLWEDGNVTVFTNGCFELIIEPV